MDAVVVCRTAIRWLPGENPAGCHARAYAGMIACRASLRTRNEEARCPARYDGLNRRTFGKVHHPYDPEILYADRDYYYNTAWQMLETRNFGNADPIKQYVWRVACPRLRGHVGYSL